MVFDSAEPECPFCHLGGGAVAGALSNRLSSMVELEVGVEIYLLPCLDKLLILLGADALLVAWLDCAGLELSGPAGAVCEEGHQRVLEPLRRVVQERTECEV